MAKKYGNPKIFHTQVILKPVIEKNLPQRMLWGVNLISRAAGKTIEPETLAKTCGIIGQVIKYEIENKGFYCKDVELWKLIGEEIFLVTKFETSYEDLGGFEEEFFEKYKIRIKFTRRQKRVFLFVIKHTVCFFLQTSNKL